MDWFLLTGPMRRRFRCLMVAALVAQEVAAAGVTDGLALLGDLHCTACHTASGPSSQWLSPNAAPRMAGIGSRVSAAWLKRYLESPHETKPGTPMPDLLGRLPPDVRAESAEALTQFLVSDDVDGLQRVTPDRAAVTRGEALYHRVGCVACHDPQNAAIHLASSVPLPDLAAKWSFDGLRQFLRDPLASRPSGRMPSLNLTDREASDIAHYLLRESRVEAPLERVDATKVTRGHALYTQLNCNACHAPGAAPDRTPALASLRKSQGCLAEQPAPGIPDFHLNPSQRSAIRDALALLQAPDLAPPSTAGRLTQSLTALRCTACHPRAGVGGVTPERDAYFTSNGEDLGDEGRLPPRLDGVGDKLQTSWLRQVLAQGSGVRPYLNTRMPVFGSHAVAPLTDLFVSLDRQGKVPTLPATPDSPELQREAGRRIMGTDGLSCIACHRFNRQPAQTLQVIDLATTTHRLEEDWFRRFLRDPNQFHPGTRMPAFWPDGVSPLTDLLGGSAERQYAALWTYLADGTRAKFPEGLSRQNVELIVGGETVVYRGKLWEAGFRAVAVGYPGQLNAAFDAEEMRLALLWRGRFLNAGPHWGVQGMGQIRPLGDAVIVFPHGAPFAVLPSPDAPWPETTSRAAGMKFGGYQLDPLRRPILLYSLRDLAVEDFLSPIERGETSGLLRVLRFSGLIPDGLHLRLATGKLTPVGARSWRLDDRMTLTVRSGATPGLQGAGDREELRVPLPRTPQGHQLEVEYVW